MSEKAISKLAKHFFRGSLKFTLQPQELETLTWENQKVFMDTTVNHKIVKKYPVNAKFARLFFKRLIELLEISQEIHDDLYTYLCSLWDEGNPTDVPYYRHFIIGNDMNKIITTKETNNMVVNGTTGMRTWEAALLLSDWVLCNRHVTENKKILELGSGVGFTGITIAKECKTNSLVLTDCHVDVLRSICDNFLINFPDMKKTVDDQKTTFKDGQRTVEVMPLDWNHPNDMPSDLVPDIIIGADIIYDPGLIPPLCDVIKKFFDRNSDLDLYLANVIRNKDTYSKFLEAIDTMDLARVDVLPSKSVYVEWDQNTRFCMLNIKKKKTPIKERNI